MDLSLHNIKKIETKLKLFDEFNILRITATDEEGREVTVSFFAKELESLTLHQTPVQIAYDR